MRPCHNKQTNRVMRVDRGTTYLDSAWKQPCTYVIRASVQIKMVWSPRLAGFSGFPPEACGNDESHSVL